jgi:hypothetical protein
MSLSIGCDAHKRYSLFAVLNSKGESVRRDRVNHERGAIKDYLSQFPEGTPVALESIGNWYWIVDEIEASGCSPQMAHALKAKLLMGPSHPHGSLKDENCIEEPHALHPGQVRTLPRHIQ